MATTTTAKPRAREVSASPLDHRPASAIEARLMRAVVGAKAFFAGDETKAKRTRVSLMTARVATAERAPHFGPKRIKALRQKTLGLSQTLFAEALNASPQTVQGWEQGTKKPSGPAIRLLELAEEHPSLIRERVVAR